MHIIIAHFTEFEHCVTSQKLSPRKLPWFETRSATQDIPEIPGARWTSTSFGSVGSRTARSARRPTQWPRRGRTWQLGTTPLEGPWESPWEAWTRSCGVESTDIPEIAGWNPPQTNEECLWMQMPKSKEVVNQHFQIWVSRLSGVLQIPSHLRYSGWICYPPVNTHSQS